jgi:hypothetical protein
MNALLFETENPTSAASFDRERSRVGAKWVLDANLMIVW